MCGIVSYYGKKDAVPILLNGLKRLEYRGYDSAGIALMNHSNIQSVKKAGKVLELEKRLLNQLLMVQSESDIHDGLRMVSQMIKMLILIKTNQVKSF